MAVVEVSCIVRSRNKIIYERKDEHAVFMGISYCFSISDHLSAYPGRASLEELSDGCRRFISA